jgi:hypothetical protein
MKRFKDFRNLHLHKGVGMENISLLPVREFPDSGAKWLLESPENVSGLLQILAPNLEKRLDFKQVPINSCHSERSEESLINIEILHFVQDDKSQQKFLELA